LPEKPRKLFSGLTVSNFLGILKNEMKMPGRVEKAELLDPFLTVHPTYVYP